MCVPDVPLHGGMGERTCSTGPVDDAAVSTRVCSLAHICCKKRVAVVRNFICFGPRRTKERIPARVHNEFAKITNIKMYLAAST